MSDTPPPADQHAHWTKEVLRRSYAMERAREHGASAEELAPVYVPWLAEMLR